MKTRTLTGLFFCCVAVQGMSNCIHAETIFFDDFTDGSVSDGKPAYWRTNGTGFLSVSSEGLAMRGTSMPYMPLAMVDGIYDGQNPRLEDTSVRTQVRLLDGVWIAVYVRLDNSNWRQPNGYIAGISSDMTVGAGGSGDGGAEGQSQLTDLDPMAEDVILQLDAIGDTISFRAWRPGESMPTDPLISFTDDAVASGIVALAVYDEGHQSVDALFRYVHVADSPIVDALPIGDFNQNGQLDVEDIDLLTTASARTPDDLTFDLNDDEVVTTDDVAIWVKDLRKTWIGDANVDGAFNTKDFVDVLTVGKYETGEFAVWSEGDWDADGKFGTSDFVAALIDGGYDLGERNDVATVPEPSGAALLILGALMVLFRRSARLWR